MTTPKQPAQPQPTPEKPKTTRPCVVLAPKWAEEQWQTICRQCGEEKSYYAFQIWKGQTCTHCKEGILDTNGWILYEDEWIFWPKGITSFMGGPPKKR